MVDFGIDLVGLYLERFRARRKATRGQSVSVCMYRVIESAYLIDSSMLGSEEIGGALAAVSSSSGEIVRA